MHVSMILCHQVITNFYLENTYQCEHIKALIFICEVFETGFKDHFDFF
jgi:hypothetical protein